MEHIQTLDEYIEQEMKGKIEHKRNSPIAGLALLAMGIALLAALHSISGADSVQTLLLTIGIISLALGLVLTGMNFSGAMWHYQYAATGIRMKDKKVYLGAEDYTRAAAALKEGDKAALAGLTGVVSSNGALRVLRSKDGSIALVQGGRYDTGHFEVETPVMVLVGTEVAAIEALCR